MFSNANKPTGGSLTINLGVFLLIPALGVATWISVCSRFHHTSALFSFVVMGERGRRVIIVNVEYMLQDHAKRGNFLWVKNAFQSQS